jgi:hypothetical protein
MESNHQKALWIQAMKTRSTVWFMEGLSSQRDIISSVMKLKAESLLDITVVASHRNERSEILSVADYSCIEPATEAHRLPFISKVIAQYGVTSIHTGRICQWYERHRREIEAMGVTLTTGTTNPEFHALADDKVRFAHYMEQNDIAAVPSQQINSIDELKHYLAHPPFESQPLCIKPVKGIYGFGFWRFDASVDSMASFDHPDSRKVHPDVYLHAVERSKNFAPMVLMPYLPGPERSIDILAEKGEVVAAVGRRKKDAFQIMEAGGVSLALATACVKLMQADGLVNVQTRENNQREPVLLEINLRPSGGIGFTRFSGVNLPGLFVMRKLGITQAAEATKIAMEQFRAATVRSVTDVLELQTDNTNRIHVDYESEELQE